MFKTKNSRALASLVAVIGITAAALFASAQMGTVINPLSALKAAVTSVAKSCYTAADIVALEAKKKALDSSAQTLLTKQNGLSVKGRDIENRIRDAGRNNSNSNAAPTRSNTGDVDVVTRLQAEYDALSAKGSRLTATDRRNLTKLQSQIEDAKKRIANTTANTRVDPLANASVEDLRAQLRAVESAKTALQAEQQKVRDEALAINNELTAAKKKSCVCMKQADYNNLQTFNSEISNLPSQVSMARHMVTTNENNVFVLTNSFAEAKFYNDGSAARRKNVEDVKAQLDAAKKAVTTSKAELKKLEAQLKKAQTQQPKLAQKLAASGGMICGGTTVQVGSTLDPATQQYIQYIKSQLTKFSGGTISLNGKSDGVVGSDTSIENTNLGSVLNELKNVPAAPPSVSPDCNQMINNGRLVYIPLGTTVSDFDKAPGWVPLAEGQTVMWMFMKSSETTQQYSFYCSYGYPAMHPVAVDNMRAVPYTPKVDPCEDGIDNDGDGLIDTKDTRDCRENFIETQCNDGIDNDEDGFIDENDSDCFNEQDDCGDNSFCDTSCPQYNYEQCNGTMLDGSN